MADAPAPAPGAPRVTVVVPAWNAEVFLRRTLATVAAQTYRDFELVVVDDGSADRTREEAEAFLAESGLPGRCLRQENKGIAAARNAGLRAARGRLAAFLDHDDAWFPRKLERAVAAFDENPGVELVCHHENVIRGGRLVRVSRNGPWTPRMYERLLFEGNALSPSAVVADIARLRSAGLFREDPAFNTVEDYDLWLRLAKAGCRMLFLDEVLGEYLWVERGASNRIAYHNRNLEALLRDHFASFPEPGLATRLRMRRRLGVMARSAARLLLGQGDRAAAGAYARRALRECPWDPKNWAVAALWAAGAARP